MNIQECMDKYIPIIIEYGINIVIVLLVFIMGKILAKYIVGLMHNVMIKYGFDKMSTFAVNFASGILIAFLRPIKKGDFVEVGGVVGTVSSINLFSVNLKTSNNKTIIVSNAIIMKGTIKTYSMASIRRVDLVVGISYSADICKARKILTDIVAGDSRVIADPASTIFVSEDGSTLASSPIKFEIRLWVEIADYWPTYFDLTSQIISRFNDECIETPSEKMDVHLLKENE